MTVGLALRANPQAPFERTSISYYQNSTAEKKPNLHGTGSLPNLISSGLADRSKGLKVARNNVVRIDAWAYRRQPFHNRASSSRIRLDANAIIDG